MEGYENSNDNEISNWNKYFFKVLDKFDIKDAVERLDTMIEISKQLEKENKDYEQLWIKETVLF